MKNQASFSSKDKSKSGRGNVKKRKLAFMKVNKLK